MDLKNVNGKVNKRCFPLPHKLLQWSPAVKNSTPVVKPGVTGKEHGANLTFSNAPLLNRQVRPFPGSGARCLNTVVAQLHPSFGQNNAPFHTARDAHEWLCEHASEFS